MKLIAIDLDGALLNSQKKISPENIEAIRLAQQNDTEVIIATGRHYQDAKKLINANGLDLPIIGSNGASLHNLEGECMMLDPIEKDDALQVFQQMKELNIAFVALGAEHVYTLDYCFPALEIEMAEYETPENAQDLARLRRELHAMVLEKSDLIRSTPEELAQSDDVFLNILAICFDSKKREAGMAHFLNKSSLHVFSSYYNNFEMTHGSVSKGHAVKAYANERHIKDYDIMAIGDNFNDQTMIHMAGIGVAMGNAVPHIKTISDFVTLSNNDHGVAHAIHTILLNPSGASQ